MFKSLRPTCSAASRLLLVSSAVLALAVSYTHAADEPVKEKLGQTSFVARDEFDGRLLLKWQPIREDPSHISLTRHPGNLTITTQRGTIHGKNNNQPDRLARNLFVIDNPLAAAAEFQMTVCVVQFAPTTDYQQAGLICHNDDDNYLKWVGLFSSASPSHQVLRILTETDTESDASPPVELLKAPDRLWLRLTRRGNIYEYSTSLDGVRFERHGERIWNNAPPKRLGLIAKNGGGRNSETIPEIDARFEYFELVSPMPDKPAP